MALCHKQQTILCRMVQREEEGKGGLLHLKCGSGKTWIAASLCISRPSDQPTLIVSEKSAIPHWCETLNSVLRHHDKVCKVPFFVLNTCIEQSAVMAYNSHGSIILASYNIAVNLLSNEDLFPRWGRIILDEAHIIKNCKSKRHKQIKLIAQRTSQGHKWLLTATPIQNCTNDLVALAQILGARDIEADLFVKEFVLTEDDCFFEEDSESEEEEQAAETDLPLDVRKQFIDMPAGSWEQELYDKVDAEYKNLIQGRKSQSMYLEAALRCMQVATHPWLYFRSLSNKSNIPFETYKHISECIARGKEYSSAKIQFIVQDISHRCAPEDSGVIVFCDWKDEMSLLNQELKACGVERVLTIVGSMSLEEREDVIRIFHTWTEDHELDCIAAKVVGDTVFPPPCVLLVQIRCGGQGINLQHTASRVYMMRPPFNPATEYQAICRVYRKGQTKPVTVTQLVTRGTIDEECFSLQDSKLDVITETLKDWTISNVMRRSKADKQAE